MRRTTGAPPVAATDLAVWAWSKPGISNFGDELGPAILTRLGYRVRRVPLRDADLVGCGSVMHLLDAARDGCILWGTGSMRPNTPVPGRVDARALRGRLTAESRQVPLGDTGLLTAALWPRPTVRHRIGVVRHYVDGRIYPWADVVIDTLDPVDDVIAQIGACATIASSSLHGLIVAQSYGIPAMRLHHDRVAGGDWKWADYLSALDRPLPDIQRDLIGVLP